MWKKVKITAPYCTSSPMFEMMVRIDCPSYIFSNNAIIPSDIWSVGKEPIAMFEFTHVGCKFPRFFHHPPMLYRYWETINAFKWVRWEVLGLLQDGAFTDLFENLSVNSLKGDLSNATTFNPPLFSMVNTFKTAVWRTFLKLELAGSVFQLAADSISWLACFKF